MILVGASIFVIGFGILCLTSQDFAWQLIQYDIQLFYQKFIDRPKNYTQILDALGAFSIVLGFVGSVVGSYTL